MEHTIESIFQELKKKAEAISFGCKHTTKL